MSSASISSTVRPLNDFASPSMRTPATSAPDFPCPAVDPAGAPPGDLAGIEKRDLARDARLDLVGDVRLGIEDADVIVARPAKLRVGPEVVVDELLGEGFRPGALHDLRDGR